MTSETPYIHQHKDETEHHYQASPLYNIFLFEGKGRISIDFTEYDFAGNIVLFSSPYQLVRIIAETPIKVRSLQFHGDFYCIEYHKKEVACNGLLFNNIYAEPFVQLREEDFDEMHLLFDKLAAELNYKDDYSKAVIRAYLQLILAISSKAKITSVTVPENNFDNHYIAQFKELLETYFQKERQPSFYAAQLGVAANTFSKNCKTYFMRSPSNMIQERVILEAKKLIHLTRKSMKSIAAELNFDDENYFSRYFKKHTGVTPSTFREKVGISIVADLSR
ncbi:AraC-type DNA-binding protein [Pedobacter sp. ok626]|uniref:AraC family transcriptional regulator n=1 Tax=Pedobacter sp. ok626 TaxID=1761882 RepID=UPI00088055A7|nr:helix-turn-helix domain-containing protein [Pedobacter sp. ok626]SDL06277.1 AraC-type DNA-binding protein [Pedobacter sp. ok626]